MQIRKSLVAVREKKKRERESYILEKKNAVLLSVFAQFRILGKNIKQIIENNANKVSEIFSVINKELYIEKIYL